jgi:hypothetical protein
MPRSKDPHYQPRRSKRRFEEWRNNRSGKARIPAELWSAAVEVARKEGINRTARELHVAWDDLKRRMAGHRRVPRQPDSPAFVELVAPQTESVPECTLELEGRRGKLRIQLKGASASYLATLSRELWSRRPDPDHAATAHPGCDRRHRRQEGHRFSGAAMPGKTGCRSVLRLSVHLPQPPGDSDKTVGL